MSEVQGATTESGGVLALPLWALRFYRRHFAWVAGLSLVASAQRVVSVMWGDQLPPLLNLSLEGVTQGVRLLLVILIARAAWAEWAPASAGRPRRSFRQQAASLRRHFPMLLAQFGLLFLVALIFKGIPDHLIAPLIPTANQKLHVALLLAAKNPTIIAFTNIWLVGMARLVLLTPPPGEDCPAPGGTASDRSRHASAASS